MCQTFDPASSHANLGPMRDPRTPELQAWIDSLPTAWDQAVTMHALCLAFPFLKICEDWRERIAVIEDAMHLRERKHQRQYGLSPPISTARNTSGPRVFGGLSDHAAMRATGPGRLSPPTGSGE